jgi:hypothetical protein
MSEKNPETPIEQLDPNMRLREPGAGGDAQLQWHSPADAPFRLSGFPWFAQDGKYRRLPVQPAMPIRVELDRLANCTAGGQIRFRTDSAKLSVKVRLRAAASMNHMPATGQCGFDCYIDIGGRQRYHNTTKYNHRLTEYECMLMDAHRCEMRAITLYFPLYQGVEEVWIGLEPGAMVAKPSPYASDKPVIVYGTSITQGGCAARPGMAYTNILSRKIPLEFINLGFSGNGKGDPEIAQLISELPEPACLVLDYEGNCKEVELVERTMPEFIRIFRSRHANAPILVMTKIRYGRELLDESLIQDRLKKTEVQRAIVEECRRQGDRNVHFFDGSLLLGEDFEECTVDGGHPTDLGFWRMAEGLAPVLQQILAGTAV